MLRNDKFNLFPLKSLYDNPVVQIASIQGGILR
jgi:hypothetical protein